MSQTSPHSGLESTISSLRSVFGIMMGLTLANSIRGFVTGGPSSSPLEGADFSIEAFALFVVFFSMAVQFFHGNVRVLDEILQPSTRQSDIADPRRRSRYSDLWFEYLFMISQAAVFGIASFYIYHPQEMILLLTLSLVFYFALLVRKAAWAAYETPSVGKNFRVWGRSDKRAGDGEMRAAHATGTPGAGSDSMGLDWLDKRSVWGHDARWLMVNSLAVALMSIPLVFGWDSIDEFGWAFWTAVAILSGRLVLDYVVNWRLYFPPGPTEMKVFIAAPFSEYQTGRGTPLDPSLKDSLSAIIVGLRRRAHRVVSPHEREGWGTHIDPVEKVAQRDYDSIVDCDVLLALYTDRPSGGLYLLVGMALGLHKPVLVLAPASTGHVNLKAIENATQILKYHTLNGMLFICEEIETALTSAIESVAAKPSFLMSGPNIPDVYIHSHASFSEISNLLAHSPFSTYAATRLHRQGLGPWLGESFGVLAQSELVIIELSDEFSGEGELDLGFALAVQKPVILLHASSRTVSPVVTGVRSLYERAENPVSQLAPRFETITYDSQEEMLAKLGHVLESYANFVEPGLSADGPQAASREASRRPNVEP